MLLSKCAADFSRVMEDEELLLETEEEEGERKDEGDEKPNAIKPKWLVHGRHLFGL